MYDVIILLYYLPWSLKYKKSTLIKSLYKEIKKMFFSINNFFSTYSLLVLDINNKKSLKLVPQLSKKYFRNNKIK